MTDKPILFNGQMVNALLEGRKTQTRRVFIPPKPFDMDDDIAVQIAVGSIKPKYNAGDRLYVCETVVREETDQGVGCEIYAADGKQVWPLTKWDRERNFVPSIHMPRWASRITLVVTDVCVQRVRDISEEDAVAEGLESWVDGGGWRWFSYNNWEDVKGDPRESFENLWNSTNEKRGFGWDKNPWVVAVTFEVHKCNIDQMGKVE